jgi:hypothetical protein
MATQPKREMQAGKSVRAQVSVPVLEPAAATTAAVAASMPTAEPPAQVGGTGARAVGTVWNNNQTVNALWSINEDRNAQVGIANVGWVKLSTNSESGVMALTALAAHAYQTQHVINYRTEDDGLIHEIYAW